MCGNPVVEVGNQSVNKYHNGMVVVVGQIYRFWRLAYVHIIPPNEKIPAAVVVAVSVVSVSVSVSVASVVTAVSVGSTGFVVAAGLAGPGIGAREL